MNNYSVCRLLAASLMLASTGCSDGRASRAQTTDTSVVARRPPVSTQSTPFELPSAAQTDTAVNAHPADVVRRYYDALERRQYDSAYALWGQSGQASGKTRAQFANGFAETVQTSATIGDSVRVEGAAGSQYATVPVTVDAVLRNGTHQHFVGTYIVRRAIADGATAEQRRWHIYSAHLQQR